MGHHAAILSAFRADTHAPVAFRKYCVIEPPIWLEGDNGSNNRANESAVILSPDLRILPVLRKLPVRYLRHQSANRTVDSQDSPDS
jgi:hypothetical protein